MSFQFSSGGFREGRFMMFFGQNGMVPVWNFCNLCVFFVFYGIRKSVVFMMVVLGGFAIFMFLGLFIEKKIAQSS